jgi:hypothetical protein
MLLNLNNENKKMYNSKLSDYYRRGVEEQCDDDAAYDNSR